MIDNSTILNTPAELMNKAIEVETNLFSVAHNNRVVEETIEFIKLELTTDFASHIREDRPCIKFTIVLNPFRVSEKYKKIELFGVWWGDDQLSYRQPPKNDFRFLLDSDEPVSVVRGLLSIMKDVLLDESNSSETESRELEKISSSFVF